MQCRLGRRRRLGAAQAGEAVGAAEGTTGQGDVRGVAAVEGSEEVGKGCSVGGGADVAQQQVAGGLRAPRATEAAALAGHPCWGS